MRWYLLAGKSDAMQWIVRLQWLLCTLTNITCPLRAFALEII